MAMPLTTTSASVHLKMNQQVLMKPRTMTSFLALKIGSWNLILNRARRRARQHGRGQHGQRQHGRLAVAQRAHKYSMH